MRQASWVWLFAIALSVAGVAAARGAQDPADKVIGTWVGKWSMGDGSSGGGFELTLEKGKDGALGGRVSVTGEPTYKTSIRKATLDGSKAAIVYDFPEDERVEVALSIAFAEGKATGTWAARERGGGADVASGTLTLARP